MISSLDKYCFKKRKTLIPYLYLNNMQSIQNTQQKLKKQRQPHIALSTDNYEKLKNLGRAGDSFNDVLTKILSKEMGVL